MWERIKILYESGQAIENSIHFLFICQLQIGVFYYQQIKMLKHLNIFFVKSVDDNDFISKSAYSCMLLFIQNVFFLYAFSFGCMVESVWLLALMSSQTAKPIYQKREREREMVWDKW